MNEKLIPMVLVVLGGTLIWGSIRNVNPLSAAKSLLRNRDLSEAEPISGDGGDIPRADIEGGQGRPGGPPRRRNQLRPEPASRSV